MNKGSKGKEVISLDDKIVKDSPEEENGRQRRGEREEME